MEQKWVQIWRYSTMEVEGTPAFLHFIINKSLWLGEEGMVDNIMVNHKSHYELWATDPKICTFMYKVAD